MKRNDGNGNGNGNGERDEEACLLQDTEWKK